MLRRFISPAVQTVRSHVTKQPITATRHSFHSPSQSYSASTPIRFSWRTKPVEIIPKDHPFLPDASSELAFKLNAKELSNQLYALHESILQDTLNSRRESMFRSNDQLLKLAADFSALTERLIKHRAEIHKKDLRSGCHELTQLTQAIKANENACATIKSRLLLKFEQDASFSRQHITSVYKVYALLFEDIATNGITEQNKQQLTYAISRIISDPRGFPVATLEAIKAFNARHANYINNQTLTSTTSSAPANSIRPK